MPDFLLYGATGYTGELIARAAVAERLRPRLAGRRPAVAALADELGLEHRLFPLDDAGALRAALADVPLVLHCAGPFGATHWPVAEACLATGRHYLDLTGEIAVFESLAARDGAAAAAGAMLLPGVGFDLVPSDCLASRVVAALPAATHLTVAVQHLPWRDARGRWRNPTISRGTAATLVRAQTRGAVRRGGRLVEVPLAARLRWIDLGAGPTSVALFPLGELAALYCSTGIASIDAYVALPWPAALALRHLAPLLAAVPLPRLLPARGPGGEELARGRSLVWVEATDPSRGRATARLRAPGGYAFTVRSALAAVRAVLAGRARPGFQTPATAFGPDFVCEVDGVELLS
ncbi:MAG TPA: saccharopine dehydrogenase NADP-binding domain-containing protein [Chloroflexota bacterium]